ncbi:MAG: mechanosensitive ion channel family protein [Sulfurimonadaceae bacterium]|nr:mechanosensitive ion channel family protein [Sulfurimonadaceae bacterium]
MEELNTLLAYELLGNTLKTWLMGAGILLVFIILRFKLIEALMLTLIKLTQKTKTTFDDKIIEVLETPLRWGVIALGFYFAFSTFTVTADIRESVQHLLRSTIILLAMWIFYRALNIFSDSMLAISRKFHSDLGESLANLIVTVLKVFVVIIGLITVFQEWGFNVSGFLASLGLVGMAFALAAKDTAANLFGSLVIFTDRPFKIGDWVKTPDVEGTIEGIGMRSTKVRTFAQALVSVPNGVLANSAILNWSEMGKRRIKMMVGLTYDTSSEQMQNILDDIRTLLKNDEEIHPETIHIYFTDFQESALGIFCYFFTNTTNWGDYMQVRERINLEIMKIVETHNAAFAFPSQSLYIESMPEPLN